MREIIIFHSYLFLFSFHLQCRFFKNSNEKIVKPWVYSHTDFFSNSFSSPSHAL